MSVRLPAFGVRKGAAARGGIIPVEPAPRPALLRIPRIDRGHPTPAPVPAPVPIVVLPRQPAASGTSALEKGLDAEASSSGKRAKRGADGGFSDEEREKQMVRNRRFRDSTSAYVNKSLELTNPDIMKARMVTQQPRKKPPPPRVSAAASDSVPALPTHRMPQFDMGLVVDMDQEARTGAGVSDRTAGLSKLCVALATAPADFFREVDGVLPDGAGIFAPPTDAGGEGKVDPRKARAVAIQLNRVLTESVKFDVWRWRTPRVAVNAEVLRAFLSQRPHATEFVKHACTPHASEIRARNLPTIPRSSWAVRPPVFDGEVPCARRAGCTVRLVGAVGWTGVADTCGLCLLCQCAEQTTVAMLLLAADPHIHAPTSACDLFFYREQCATDDDGYPAASMLISKSFPDAPFVPFRKHHYTIEYRPIAQGGAPVPHVVRSKITLPTPSSVPGFRHPLR